MDWAIDRKLQHFVTTLRQYEHSNMSTCSVPPARAQQADPKKGLAQSVGGIWEDQDHKSMELSLEDFVIGNAELQQFPDVGELLPFRVEHEQNSPIPYGNHSPAQQHGGFEFPVHHQNHHQNAFVPNNGWGAHRGGHGFHGPHHGPPYHDHHRQDHRWRDDHHRRILPYKEVAPRHVRYNQQQFEPHHDEYGGRCESAPPPSCHDIQSAASFRPQMSRDDFSRWDESTDIAAESVRKVLSMEMAPASQSAPQSPTKKMRPARDGFVGGLDTIGLDANGPPSVSPPTETD